MRSAAVVEQHTPPRTMLGNFRFETEKFSPLSDHSLCNTSTLYTTCIPYAVFMGRVRLVSIQSIVMLTVRCPVVVLFQYLI